MIQHMADIKTPERNLLKDFRTLSNRIMHLAIHGLLRIDFLQKVSEILTEFSKCEGIEMWLVERGKFYRSLVMTSPKKPFQCEIIPSTQDMDGRVIPDIKRNSRIDEICMNTFLGQFDPDLPNITKNGSYWTGADQFPDGGLNGKTKSLLITPISVENENTGILKLISTHKNYFSEDDVKFYEAIVQSLGIALKHRRAQVELQERVKELTCLFSIAKVVELPNISLQSILKEIVKLLPPAWLYPEIASARISLDGDSYTTPDFQSTEMKQSADIVVSGIKRGIVELIYSEERPELDEGPFLKEERSLIDTLAREIALIVERKQTEEDKAKLQEQLRHADRLATIGQLSAGVAHELNEPIGSILGFAQLVQKDPEISDQAKIDIEKIMKASLHAREVIKKLMLFSRQMPPQKIRVNLNQIIQDGLYFLESRCAKEGIEVVRHLSPSLPDVTADPSQMTQVLVNTVVNAIQAMPTGGRLTIKTLASEKLVMLEVGDTGAGMDKNVKRQIFQPFFTTKDVGMGTGLGLSVVYGIITSHGGSIDVDSKVGQGTKIKIKLPFKEPSQVKGEV
jgi:two-component system NtrC family sensor kinase